MASIYAYAKGGQQDNSKHISEVCNVISSMKETTMNAAMTDNILRKLLISSINRTDSDDFKVLFVNMCLPQLINTKFNPNGLAYRQCIMLCRRLVCPKTYTHLFSTNGFLVFIQEAINNEYPSISHIASDVLVKMIVYSPTTMSNIFETSEVDTNTLIGATKANLSSEDATLCIDALHVAHMMNNANILKYDDIEFYEKIAEIFCCSTTPYVSKKAAEFISSLIETDKPCKDILFTHIRKNMNDNQPCLAARHWKQVNDVITIIN